MFFLSLTDILQAMPSWYITLFSFLFGISIGSFLNVCIYRLPLEDTSVFFPLNSHCTKCNYQLRWYDNIPILSWVYLRGRCRSCHAPISFQYPAVELLTGIFALAVVKRFHPTLPALLVFLFICGLLVATFVDLKYWIIPDEVSYPGMVLGLVGIYFFPHPGLPSFQSAVIGCLVGGGTLLAVILVYKFIAKREGMGLGDVKLLALIGVFVGWEGIPLVVLFASLQGIIVILFLLAIGWKGQPPYEIWEEEEDSQPETSQENEQTVAEETEETEEEVESGSVEQKEENEQDEQGEENDDDEVRLGLVPLPFGPFLVLGGIEVLFWGQAIMGSLRGY